MTKNAIICNNAVFALALVLTACSMGERKNTTGLEQVQKNRQVLKETGDKLETADAELARFKTTVSELKNQFSKSEEFAIREKAGRTLDRLALKVDEAELDIQDLRAENTSVSRDLDRRLKEVAETNRQLMEGDRKNRERQ